MSGCSICSNSVCNIFPEFCDECSKEFCKVCTCEKPFRFEPKQFCMITEDGSWKYYDINPTMLLKLLRHWSNNYYIIEGCRGCKLNQEDIRKNVFVGLKSAVEACVYEEVKLKDNLHAMRYLSDALDDDYITAVKKIISAEKLEEIIGKCSDI